uniref:Major facilitator superfamily MFS_1 n=1 Tax=Cyanothece sp. (strain PCC 7425 / ATCC 29141) TaxID=395961 RepID=B8HXR5_CYAP4
MPARPTSQGSLQFILRAFRSRNYRLFFTGQAMSLIGTWMTQTALIWLVYRLTGSALLLGVVGFANQIPSLLLTPVAGVLVDRIPRRQTLVITQVLAMSQSLALAYLALTDRINITWIIGLSIFQGLVNAFDAPARQAFVVDIVENRADLGNAIALNSSMFSGARLVGPAIAGVIVAAVGPAICFFIDGISYIFVITALLLMQIAPLVSEPSSPRSTLWKQLWEGLTYAFGFPPIRAILLLIALVSLMGMPYTVLAPIFAENILKGGAETLGFLMAASGLGALVAGLYLSSRPTILGLGQLLAIAPAFFGLSLIIFALSHSLPLSLFMMFWMGLSLILQIASSNTILQTIVEEDKRGRVMSLFTIAFLGIVPFGNLAAGFLASVIGAPYTLVMGGIFCILGSLLFVRQLPRLRSYVRPIYASKGILPVSQTRS